MNEKECKSNMHDFEAFDIWDHWHIHSSLCWPSSGQKKQQLWAFGNPNP